ncbi:MAG: hypothetical protein Q4B26_00940 [Eubacteriales bacterium]|nr:hypothetical protein [Eubacteriales bacterium]
MISRLQRILSLGTTGIITILIVGLLWNSKKDITENQAYVKQILQEKYNKEFKVKGFKTGGEYGSYFALEAYALDMPELPFSVRVYQNDKHVVDDYVAKRISYSLSSRIREILADEDHHHIVYVQPPSDISTATDPDITIDEFYAAGNQSDFDVIIFYSDEYGSSADFYAGIERIASTLPDFQGTIEIILVKDEKITEIEEYTKSHATLGPSFDELLGDVRATLISVENGELSKSKKSFDFELNI